MFRFVRFLPVIAVLVALFGYGWWYVRGQDEKKTSYRTAVVDRGDILTTITATGTIEPEEVIDIGAQVLGMIREFGCDPQRPSAPVDYGTHVEKGTVLARIDESLYRAAVKQAAANMHQTEANVRQMEASLRSMKSKLEQTKRDWERVQKIEPTKALSQLDVDTAKNAYETAEAAVPGCEAALEAARKAVEVSRAALETAELNLSYCTIVAPVKGVIVDRRVNIGQTVVASLSAPSLFLLAKDLTRLQVWASVNEADIGQIHPGQTVSFKVAAYPGERFKGTVLQTRLNATMTQNVVTYTVVVATDNISGRLLPYMTATLNFEVARRNSVLRVPSAAMRWEPTMQQVAPEFRAAFVKSAGDPSRPTDSSSFEGSAKNGPSRVWLEDGSFVRPLNVEIGLSDGLLIEILGDELREGMRVVVGETDAGSVPESSNPFAPKLPGKK
jgi:HlyD family secretion protein